MATKINLKKRTALRAIEVPIPVLKNLIEQEDKDGLFDYFKGIAKQDFEVHDKQWLELIINWVPEGGHALTESAKWFKLANRVADLDTDKEGAFTLSPYQVDLLWNRLNNSKFTVERLPTAFVAFIVDFQTATGRHFPEEEPDAEDQSE